MAAAVATPLEKQFSTIAGIDNMTSSSTLGSVNITLQFTLDRDIDAAAQDVQAAIAKTLRQLPTGIIPPSYQKTNPAAASIILFALTSSTVPIQQLDEAAETMIAQRLSTIDGVAQVQVFGAAKYAVRVQVDPVALAYRKIGIDEVADAINAQNVNQPTGVLWGPKTAYTLQANGQLQNAAGFRQLSVVYRNGAAVRLDMLGKVLDGIENNRSASWYNGARSIVLAVQRQPGTNTVAVAEKVQAEMNALKSQVPNGIQIHTLFDRSVAIQESVQDVKFTLLLTLALVVLVIFLFLRNVWATIIPSLALPMSLLGAFAVMYMLGYSLDNLSLMALTLAVGFVVDDAIVMLENIVRHLEMGKPPMTAAIDGAREVGFTIVSMTVSLTAVFIPIIFLPASSADSSASSRSPLPPRFSCPASYRSRSRRCCRAGSSTRTRERSTDACMTRRSGPTTRLLELYKRTLDWAMLHRRMVMIFSVLVLVGTGVLLKLVPTGFIPTQDTGSINVTTEAAQGTSFDDMVRRQRQVADIVQADPNVQALMSTVGSGGGASGANAGRLQVTLKPRGDRVAVDEVVAELRRKLARLPGITAYPQIPPAIQIGGRQSKSQYQFSMQGSDVATLYPAAAKLIDAARRSATLQDVTSDLQLNNPQVNLKIDRTRAATFGVTADQIESRCTMPTARGRSPRSTRRATSTSSSSSCCRNISRTSPPEPAVRQVELGTLFHSLWRRWTSRRAPWR